MKIFNEVVNFFKKNFYKLALLVLVVFLPIISLAANPPCEEGKICNPINISTLNGLIKTILEGVVKIGIPIIALAIIYSGFLFVSARGNSEKITKAKDALLYTLIGAAVILGSWAIAQLISDTVLQL